MKAKQPKPGLPEIRTKPIEIELILKSFAMSDTMDELLEDPYMYKRLSAIPNAVSGVKMMRGRLNQMLYDLAATLPPNRKKSVLCMAPHMRYKVMCGMPAAKEKDKTIIDYDDLNVVAKYASEWCKMCVDGKCNTCPLGKTFDKILTYDRDRGESWATWSGWNKIEL